VLLGGENERAARALLAAFAWAAADIAALAHGQAVLEAVADVLHWQGLSVVVVAVESREPVVVRRLDRRSGARTEETSFVIRVGGRPTWLLVVAGEGLTTAALEGVAAFARLMETCLTRIAERETLASELARQEARTRTVIASERLSALSEAAAVLAHEMRNPLGTISNAVAVLHRPGSDDHPVALAIVHEEVGRLDMLVQDLLQLARPLAPASSCIELDGLVGVTLERSRRELKGTHVLVPPPPTSERVAVRGDPALLGLALENLVRNAAQAAPRGSEIRIAIEPRVAEVTVSVEDDGPGIALAAQERIFDPFFTTRPVGTGLGLSIVRRLVEAHGGAVRVGSSRSGGARFDLVFARST
jgi:signal transduction histidine kinase